MGSKADIPVATGASDIVRALIARARAAQRTYARYSQVQLDETVSAATAITSQTKRGVFMQS